MTSGPMPAASPMVMAMIGVIAASYGGVILLTQRAGEEAPARYQRLLTTEGSSLGDQGKGAAVDAGKKDGQAAFELTEHEERADAPAVRMARAVSPPVATRAPTRAA